VGSVRISSLAPNKDLCGDNKATRFHLRFAMPALSEYHTFSVAIYGTSTDMSVSHLTFNVRNSCTPFDYSICCHPSFYLTIPRRSSPYISSPHQLSPCRRAYPACLVVGRLALQSSSLLLVSRDLSLSGHDSLLNRNADEGHSDDNRMLYMTKYDGIRQSLRVFLLWARTCHLHMLLRSLYSILLMLPHSMKKTPAVGRPVDYPQELTQAN